MKVYAFTDSHGNLRALKRVEENAMKEKVDAILCLGDFTIFESDFDSLLRKINELPAPVFLINGNHEEEERTQAACQVMNNITFVHRKPVEFKDWTFVGFGGGGFSKRYPELEELLKEWQINWGRTVFLSHAPPYGTRLDDVGEDGDEWHVGSKTLRDLCRKLQPPLVLAGHIHECFGAKDRIGKTVVANPGPKGALFDLAKLF